MLHDICLIRGRMSHVFINLGIYKCLPLLRATIYNAKFYEGINSATNAPTAANGPRALTMLSNVSGTLVKLPLSSAACPVLKLVLTSQER